MVVGWHPAGERARAGGGLQPSGVIVVLDDHRDAVQRPARHASAPFGISRIGLGERVAVGDADRVQRRTALVVCIDARQVIETKSRDVIVPASMRRPARC